MRMANVPFQSLEGVIVNIENLAVGETEIASVSVRPSPLLFWLKVNLHASEKRIVGRSPNTFMGVIPVGSENLMFPLKQVAGLTVSTRVKPIRVIFGALLFIGGLSSFAKGGFLLALLGAALVVAGIQAVLVIQNTGGGTKAVSVSLLDKSAISNFASTVRSHLINL